MAFKHKNVTVIVLENRVWTGNHNSKIYFYNAFYFCDICWLAGYHPWYNDINLKFISVYTVIRLFKNLYF